MLAPRALLTYLVSCGDAFYAPEAFGGRVFLDPSWIIDAAYRMFEPGPKGPRWTLEQLQNGGEGTITGTQFKQIVWPEASDADVRHYLAFLTASEIVLEIGRNSRWELGQRRFVIPALLPDVTAAKLKQLRDHTAWELHLEFAFPLLHRALVERLLVRSASKNAERQWWRNTAHWYDDSTRCTVLLDARPTENKIFLRVAVGRSGDAPEALARLLLLLRESEQQLPYQVRLSEDDEHYATLDALEHALRTNSDVACGDTVISPERFAAVYDALGTAIPVLEHSGYGSSDERDARREGSTTIIHNLTNYGSVNMATYNSKNTNSPFATTVQGDHSSAHVTAGTLTQDEHREQIKRAQNALIEDQDSIEPATYDLISQLLRLVREVRVEQKGLRAAQAEVKTLVDDVWAQVTAKGMKPKPLSDALEVVKQLSSNPLTLEVAKKLIGS